ncbi:MAG: hypothetical protein L0Y72_10735 [Gemmataceae bacterium]|nr:hypothetical protein [Gemmataceae bacterium]MCI0739510.1 hypothetical protein [Gemmataceae bacterium]
MQVQKLHNVPLILAGKMYADMVAWCRTYMLRPEFPLASPPDMDLPICVDDGPSIVRILREHHGRWKSAQKN